MLRSLTLPVLYRRVYQCFLFRFSISSKFYYLFFYLKSASTVCSSKGQALQLTSGLDLLSIQAYRLWMEHPSRGKVTPRRIFISALG
jgi:hypothetical protein